MKQIRSLLTSHLKTIHPRVYFLKSPKNAVPPYLVYSVEIYDIGEGLQTVTLDIDGWDIRDDTSILEDLMSRLDENLNEKVLTDTNLSVSFYLDRKLPMVEDDPRIMRRLYMYQGRLFKRE